MVPRRGTNGNAERAVKHLIIAANQGISTNQGCNGLIELLFEMIKKEILASKEELHLAATLHATKSPQRDAAEGYYRN